jgi:RNA recognition motif-containing protein
MSPFPLLTDVTERKISMSFNIYVGNLTYQTTSDDLRQLFAGYGSVQRAQVAEDRDTGRSRGFGFVEMASREEGESAINSLNGQDFKGRNLNINEAKPRENKSYAGSGSRSGW